MEQVRSSPAASSGEATDAATAMADCGIQRGQSGSPWTSGARKRAWGPCGQHDLHADRLRRRTKPGPVWVRAAEPAADLQLGNPGTGRCRALASQPDWAGSGLARTMAGQDPGRPQRPIRALDESTSESLAQRALDNVHHARRSPRSGHGLSSRPPPVEAGSRRRSLTVRTGQVNALRHPVHRMHPQRPQPVRTVQKRVEAALPAPAGRPPCWPTCGSGRSARVRKDHRQEETSARRRRRCGEPRALSGP